MTAPPPYGRSPRVPGPWEEEQTYFLVGNNNQHPHLLDILLLPTRTGNDMNWKGYLPVYINQFRFISAYKH